MSFCTACGRRQRPRRIVAPAAQLAFDWTPPGAPALRPVARHVSLLLLHAYPDAEGQPRPALLPAGARVPILFPTVAAALAAKRSIEATQ